MGSWAHCPMHNVHGSQPGPQMRCTVGFELLLQKCTQFIELPTTATQEYFERLWAGVTVAKQIIIGETSKSAKCIFERNFAQFILAFSISSDGVLGQKKEEGHLIHWTNRNTKSNLYKVKWLGMRFIAKANIWNGHVLVWKVHGWHKFSLHLTHSW